MGSVLAALEAGAVSCFADARWLVVEAVHAAASRQPWAQAWQASGQIPAAMAEWVAMQSFSRLGPRGLELNRMRGEVANAVMVVYRDAQAQARLPPSIRANADAYLQVIFFSYPMFVPLFCRAIFVLALSRSVARSPAGPLARKSGHVACLRQLSYF